MQFQTSSTYLFHWIKISTSIRLNVNLPICIYRIPLSKSSFDRLKIPFSKSKIAQTIQEYRFSSQSWDLYPWQPYLPAPLNFLRDQLGQRSHQHAVGLNPTRLWPVIEVQFFFSESRFYESRMKIRLAKPAEHLWLFCHTISNSVHKVLQKIAYYCS